MLHVLVVGLIAATALGTVSLASEAGQGAALDAGAQTVDAVETSALEARSGGEQDSAFSALSPVNVPPPQSQVAPDDLVLRTHMLPPPACVEDPAHPTFCVYTVQPGDTLSGIALTYGISGNEHLSAVEMLAQSNKPDVVSSDQIVPGQKLRLPKRVGIIHTVFSAGTLSEIAGKYGVTVEDVIAVPENGIALDGHIEVGQDILIPDPQHLPPVLTPELPPIPIPTEDPAVLDDDAPEPVEPPPVETTEPVEPPPVETVEPTPISTPEPIDTVEPEPKDTPEPIAENDANNGTSDGTPVIIVSDLGDRPPEASVYGFVWPVWGPISSYFEPGHPLGIDIDLYDDPNMPIGAAKTGIVTFAGGNTCCSYGLYVIVEHGDGTSTLYAHLSQIAVVQGQVVSTGQLLGFSGATGYATGNHLHFEVRIGDSVVDPLIFLPQP